MPLPASHWRVGCACHARCFSARSNLTRLLRKIPDTKSRLLAKSLDPQDLSEGSLSVVARCQVHQQRVRLAAECLTHTEVALVDGPNCVIVFTERLLLTKEQSSMLQGRWAATAAETTSGMAATSGELQPYRNRKRISTIRPRAAAQHARPNGRRCKLKIAMLALSQIQVAFGTPGIHRRNRSKQPLVQRGARGVSGQAHPGRARKK